MTSKLKDIFENPIRIDDNKPDMGRCEECREVLELSSCIRDYGHHDGWEMPAYTELLCPLCETGFIAGDVWFSDEEKLNIKTGQGNEQRTNHHSARQRVNRFNIKRSS